ncbi:MAG: Flp pilus assembly protein CpaB [Polaromonas sp.]|nr:Flp pilus assembly protein CpaB [Polaromonas sp.]
MAVSINKNWLLLAGAVALGGLAFFLSNRAINSRIIQLEEEATRGKTMVRVVVANRPLQAGEVIDSSVVSVRQVPSEFVNKTTVVPDTYDSVDGQALQVDVQRGEPLLSSYTASRGGELFSAVLKNGRRALTIEVDEISSISGLLRPGDRIDLMLTAKAPETGSVAADAKEFTFPMLSNVEILATGQAQKAKPAAGAVAAQGFSHITLDVTPQEGTRIIAAKAAGRLTAVLRSPGDKVANPSRALSIDDVVASIAPTTEGQRRMVEFIIGGSGGGSVTSTPALDAAMKDPNNRAIAERVAQNMTSGGAAAPTVPAPAAAAAPAAGTAPAARPGYPAPITAPVAVPVRR